MATVILEFRQRMRNSIVFVYVLENIRVQRALRRAQLQHREHKRAGPCNPHVYERSTKSERANQRRQAEGKEYPERDRVSWWRLQQVV